MVSIECPIIAEHVAIHFRDTTSKRCNLVKHVIITTLSPIEGSYTYRVEMLELVSLKTGSPSRLLEFRFL